MSIRIVAIRLSGGDSHQRITKLWWTNPANGDLGESTRAAIVSWIEQDRGKVYVEDAFGHRIDVAVVRPPYGQPYLRTHADGYWTDNLLALPRR